MSAQRNLLPLDEPAAETEAVQHLGSQESFALKEQVVQRLAQHRARRTQRHANSATPSPDPAPPVDSRTARIAAAVAERYANSQSYRAFLAAQAETAIREAQAAAEVAVLNARAVADAQYQLLAELDQWTLTSPALPAAPDTEVPTAVESLLITEVAPAPLSAQVAPGLTVRHYDQDQVTRAYPDSPTSNRNPLQAAMDETESLALDEEIAFRQSPVFEDVTPVDIPANLIEFPRQLVAPRKARPRLAEGPLREEADQHPNPEKAQLRIFEVETAQISTAPAVESAAPEWSSILLAAHPQPTTPVVATPEAPFHPTLSPQTAPFNLRLMAAIVDGCIVAAALLAFIAVAAITAGKFAAGHPAPSAHMTPQAAALAAIATFLLLTLFYQFLFFTFSDATPGMRYARIGLCTFSDDNPTRAAMRQRIFAGILAALPLGIGFLWAWLDDNGLGWHDRISRMYQRSY
jgi:uncharacterized RDD family membrane protein YckC